MPRSRVSLLSLCLLSFTLAACGGDDAPATTGMLEAGAPTHDAGQDVDQDAGDDADLTKSACGDIPRQGVCRGNSVVRCESTQLDTLIARQPCGRRTCTEGPEGARCVLASADGGTRHDSAPPEGDAGPDAATDAAGDSGVPGSWHCDASHYAAQDGCHCGCGAPDPDCDTRLAPVLGCAAPDELCSAEGECVAGCPGLPAGGACNGSTVEFCKLDDAGAYAIDHEHCIGDQDACAIRGGVAQCGPPATPTGWSCEADYYATNDGCDCECGAVDPDCFNDAAELYGCGLGQNCAPSGHCQTACAGVPAGGRCEADHVVQCNDGNVQNLPCAAGERCKRDATAQARCVDAGTPQAGAPDGWTCDPTLYAAGDGCDCNCGVGTRDPDCELEGQETFGCRGVQTCDQQGLCSNPPAPDPACGDGYCNGEERITNCPRDCKELPAIPGSDLDGTPDLTIVLSDLRDSLSLDILDVQPGSCLRDEAQLCVTGTGERKLMRFTTTIANVGTADHIVGDPEHIYDPNWYWDTCHGHHHYQAYAAYDLLNDEGDVEVVGAKQGFFVIDTGAARADCRQKFLAEVQAGGTAFEIQGISAGCSDSYEAHLPCQWIDITDVPAGDYTLRVQANPNRNFEELSYDNNVATLDVRITAQSVQLR